MQNKRFFVIAAIITGFITALVLNGAQVRRRPQRSGSSFVPKGRPHYEKIFADGKMRIAVFWGWDHPRDTIMYTFPAFENLNGKKLYYKGRPVMIEIGMITQINENPKQIFKKALEDSTIDVIIYSGHARYGGGMAFASKTDIFRSGNGDLIEDRHTKPYKVYRATSEDLDKTDFSSNYKIVMLNCCDSEGHFRKSWSRRFKECSAPVDLLTVEYPVFNYYDHRRVLNFLQDLLRFADWKTIKKSYESEVHKRKNRLIIKPVKLTDSRDLTSRRLGSTQ
ncbi:MAG: hypothetical protein ACQETH_01255 [Candidatus Rifleibacteriota bacterium]